MLLIIYPLSIENSNKKMEIQNPFFDQKNNHSTWFFNKNTVINEMSTSLPLEQRVSRSVVKR